MPPVNDDSQCLMIDGRRTWLVSASIQYAKIPRGLWRSRIQAARQAGLNCIETSVFWSLHEPHPGDFQFTGDADLRHFVQLIAAESMFCILRPGPYIGADWDFGGLPPWLHRIDPIKFRQNDPNFLQASSSYLAAVMEQVQDLQVSSPFAPRSTGIPTTAAIGGGGGPIILFQAENHWFCRNPEQAKSYLKQIVRYLRENGCSVPICLNNRLWQQVEGAFDTWNANAHLAADLRQLQLVQPDAPRLVSEFQPGLAHSRPGNKNQKNSSDVLTQLAQVLSSGSQYNLSMFHAETAPAFFAGRGINNPADFSSFRPSSPTPLLPGGSRGEQYLRVKQISTFASQFASLFASLDPTRPHTTVSIDSPDHPLSVVHLRGAQGHVVFLFKSPADPTTQTDLLLPNGRTTPVHLGNDRVAWLIHDANLGGVAELTYTNLRPWAFLGKSTLVLFGPTGSPGLVCINQAILQLTVPTGRTPGIHSFENLTIVILNPEQLDAAYFTHDTLFVGAGALDENNQPLPLKDWSKTFQIDLQGRIKSSSLKPKRTPQSPRLEMWQQAPITDLVLGRSNQFQPIKGPASLESLNADFGYGWYRLELPSNPTGNILAPGSGDRLHFYDAGKLSAILGQGPDAESNPVNLKQSPNLVIFADNLGRFSEGWRLGEQTGLLEHLYTVIPVSLGKHTITPGRAPDPFLLGGFFEGCRVGDHPQADTLSWPIKASPGLPTILDIRSLPFRAMIFANNKPVALYDPHYSAGFHRIILHQPGELRPSGNELKLALFSTLDRAVSPAKFLRLYQATSNLTDKAKWSFAKWTLPTESHFEPFSTKPSNQPRWFRAQFKMASLDAPLFLEPKKLSKGQIYLNGHNLARYFLATHKGKEVPSQNRFYLPEPWLKTNAHNELLLFDEHGVSPTACRLTYNPS